MGDASRVRMGAVMVVVLLGGQFAPAALASSGWQASADTSSRHVVFSITSPLVAESSSLAVSTVHPDLVYTTNDSGDSATIYVLRTSDGRLVGQTELTGVAAVDVEALAIGADGSLVVGDIGDNHAERGSIAVYRLPQPGRGRAAVAPRAVTLTYPDGARDAESLLYDAGTGTVYVASKLLGRAKVYRSPPGVFGRGRARLAPEAAAPAIATDATFVDANHYVVIRTYFSAVVYRYPSWKKVDSFDLPSQPQGESVAAPAGGKVLWIGSEGEDSKVLRVRLPDLDPSVPPTGDDTTASAGPPPAARSEIVTVDSPGRQQSRLVALRVAEVAGAGLVLVVALGLVRYRRHRHDR